MGLFKEQALYHISSSLPEWKKVPQCNELPYLLKNAPLSDFGEGTVYGWLLNASGLAGFLSWLGILISHMRFRRAYLAQGNRLSDLPYVSKWYPAGPILAIILCLTAILGQNYSVFFGPKIDWYGAFVSYIGLPLFLLAYFGYKIVKRTKVVPLHLTDLSRE